jgi:predicted DNA-binding protein
LEPIKKLRGEHCLSVFISHELKSRLMELSDKYDRSMADIVRALMKIGIPMMEGISQAEETMMNEYLELFRRMRKVRRLNE